MDQLVGMLTSSLQYAVSGDKIRYKNGDFDLDLTYITNKIIAMAIPGENVDKAWRNPIGEVARFLNTMHGSSYQVFNISQEKYSSKQFAGTINTDFGWPDHHAPPLDVLLNLVKEMDVWMKLAPQNVLVVHCKAGRSRTGVAVCAYLLYTGLCADAESAIKLFNSKRSLNENGVVLPSQMRAIASFERVVKEGHQLLSNPKRLYLKEIIIKPVICADDRDGGSCLAVTEVQELGTREPHHTLVRSNHPTFWSKDDEMILKIGTVVQGDIQLRFHHYTQSMLAFMKAMNRLHNMFVATQTVSSNYAYPLVPLFRFSFHTSFIDSNEIVLNHENLDNIFAGPLKNKKYISPNLRVKIVFSEPPGPPGPASLLDKPIAATPGAPMNVMDLPAAPSFSTSTSPVLKPEVAARGRAVSMLVQSPPLPPRQLPPAPVHVPEPEFHPQPSSSSIPTIRAVEEYSLGGSNPRVQMDLSPRRPPHAQPPANGYTVIRDVHGMSQQMSQMNIAPPRGPNVMLTPSMSGSPTANRRHSVHVPTNGYVLYDQIQSNPSMHLSPAVPHAHMLSPSAPPSPNPNHIRPQGYVPQQPNQMQQAPVSSPNTNVAHWAALDSGRRSLPPSFAHNNAMQPPPLVPYQQSPIQSREGFPQSTPVAAVQPAPYTPTSPALPTTSTAPFTIPTTGWPPGYEPPAALVQQQQQQQTYQTPGFYSPHQQQHSAYPTGPNAAQGNQQQQPPPNLEFPMTFTNSNMRM
eukprot:TRINITY_DN3543_c0_g3_i1.p1 TRINITY_DN3543_c0_g3~~TRINITY_DN3543_c0_g3_i1.p1  ORF type:complete len:743 (-),score=81.71 TRINITY_DN3543_c0_g3_i1:498-2726(-)